MNSTRQVYQGSIFGYILAHTLAPTEAHARAAYMRVFALIAACPCLYTDAVENFNRKSLVPFKALINFTFSL